MTIISIIPLILFSYHWIILGSLSINWSLIESSIDWYCLKDCEEQYINGFAIFHVKCALVYKPKICSNSTTTLTFVLQWWKSLPNLSELQGVSLILVVGGSILVPSLPILIGCWVVSQMGGTSTGTSGRIFPYTT